MPKINGLKLAAVILVAGLTLGFQSSAAAWKGLPVDETSGQKIINLCARQLSLSADSKDSRLAGCVYGYVAAISSQKSSACSDRYKSDNKAAKACMKGFDVGKDDPLGIKPKKGGHAAGTDCTGSNCCDQNHCDLIALYINPLIKLLGLLVGLVVAASLVLGGIQYITSSGDSQKVSAAKSRISNTLLAFLAFAFLYAFLNFLIPGGDFPMMTGLKPILMAAAVSAALVMTGSFAAVSGTASAAPVSKVVASAADNCDKSGFFGLEPWYHFMPDSEIGVGKIGATPVDKCGIKCFNIFPQSQPNECGETDSDVPGVILAIIDDLLRIAALAAVAFIIMGAFQFVGSRGNSERTAAAQSTIINALTGLAVALVAVALVSFLGSQLL